MRATRTGRTRMDKAKPFDISRRAVWEAYKRVKARHGAAGIDGQSIAQFDGDLSNNLFGLGVPNGREVAPLVLASPTAGYTVSRSALPIYVMSSALMFVA